MSFGGESIAGELFTALIAGEDFTIPTVDLDDPLYVIPGDTDSELYRPVVKITNNELTEQRTDGTGTFDIAMGGFRAQLIKEFNEGRISGAEYTKAFIALAESAMSGAIQFLIARDQAFWQAQSAQANAIVARVGLATAKVQYATAVMQARNAKAEFAVTKLRLANEDAQYGQTKYQVDNLMPAQLVQLGIQNDIAEFQRDNMLPLQEAAQTKQNEILDYQIDIQLPAQTTLVNEQKEAARAQTTDFRTDHVPVSNEMPVLGVLGKQKDLYTQQIDSYAKATKLNAGKVITEGFMTIGAIQDFPDTPSNFGYIAVNAVLDEIKSDNGF